MTDPLRNPRPLTGEEVPERDGDSRIEDLLLLGLDHYFADQHELAISVWSRVLFLDRGHARARAYIERARSAILERQREAEELVHTGAAAFDRGDAGAARRLLTSAVEGGASDEAQALLDRLDRLAPAAAKSDAYGVRRSVLPAPSEMIPRAADRAVARRAGWIATGVVTGLALATGAVWVWVNAHEPRLATPPNTPHAAALADEPLPIPTAAEASLDRARSFFARGRVHDALAALDGIRLGDPLRTEADELRAAIQRQLLDASHATQPAVSSEARPPRP